MSNTYKHKKFGYFHSLQVPLEDDAPYGAYFRAWDEYDNDPKYGKLYDYHFYSHNPSWWTRETMNRPARRETHVLLNNIDLNNYEDELTFPDWKKPYNYYW